MQLIWHQKSLVCVYLHKIYENSECTGASHILSSFDKMTFGATHQKPSNSDQTFFHMSTHVSKVWLTRPLREMGAEGVVASPTYLRYINNTLPNINRRHTGALIRISATLSRAQFYCISGSLSAVSDLYLGTQTERLLSSSEIPSLVPKGIHLTWTANS